MTSSNPITDNSHDLAFAALPQPHLHRPAITSPLLPSLDLPFVVQPRPTLSRQPLVFAFDSSINLAKPHPRLRLQSFDRSRKSISWQTRPSSLCSTSSPTCPYHSSSNLYNVHLFFLLSTFEFLFSLIASKNIKTTDCSKQNRIGCSKIKFFGDGQLKPKFVLKILGWILI